MCHKRFITAKGKTILISLCIYRLGGDINISETIQTNIHLLLMCTPVGDLECTFLFFSFYYDTKKILIIINKYSLELQTFLFQ